MQDFPTDGDDLVFERICQAIQFRYKNLAPDLSVVTDKYGEFGEILTPTCPIKRVI
jgi:hypothetical protein